MDDQTCYPAIIYILATGLAWHGIYHLSSFSLPRHLTTSYEHRKWKLSFVSLVYTLAVSFCSLSFWIRSSTADDIVKEYPCSGYSIACLIWTHYVLDLSYSILHIKTPNQVLVAVHHLATVATASVPIFYKIVNVYFVLVPAFFELCVALVYLSKLMALSGIQRNGLFYQSVMRARNVAIICTRVPLWAWFQWQLLRDRADMETTPFLICEACWLVLAGVNFSFFSFFFTDRIH